MPIEFLPPLPPLAGWVSHMQDVKRCRGTACYGALVAHFGTDSPKLLEWRVDRRKPYRTREDESVSNKYRRWRQGLALPGDGTVAHVAKRSNQSVRLEHWRDLPLWTLLDPEPPPMAWMLRLLERAPRPIERILFGLRESSMRVAHTQLDRHQTLAIRDQHSLDAFIVLLCLARKGEALEDDPRHYLPASCAFQILPNVLYRHRALRYRWEGLFECLDRIFWKRMYVTGAYYKFPIETVRSGLERLTMDTSAELLRIAAMRSGTTGYKFAEHVDDEAAHMTPVNRSPTLLRS